MEGMLASTAARCCHPPVVAGTVLVIIADLCYPLETAEDH